jgi:hypothetical protein
VSEPARIRAFFQRWHDRAGVETSLVDGDKAVGPVRFERMVVTVPTVLARIRDAIGGAMRLVAMVIFVSPLAILVKLALPQRASDYVTVGFVITLVAFFALLSLYFLASFLWWRGRDRRGLQFAPPPDTDPDADAIVVATPADAKPKTRARARGRIVALDDTTKIVVRAFAGHDGHPWRIVETSDFAVMPKDGLPVIAHVRGAPLLVSLSSRRISTDEASKLFAPTTLALADSHDSGDYVEVAVGDEVEIVGTIDRVVPDSNHFTIDGAPRSLPHLAEGDPYRRPAGPAIVIGLDTDPRITIRPIPPARTH